MQYKMTKLCINDGKDVYDMLQEIPDNENGFINSVYGKSYEEYKDWLLRNEKMANGIELEDWMVPQNTYWFYVDEELVGTASVRHYLTDALLQVGGHCGYSIRPKERGKGYGSVLLGLLIEEARNLNMNRLLLTIQNQNIASTKVALKNGGVIEKENEVRKYIWINLI